MKIETVGSVCSGIEAASVAWDNWEFKWFSEIAEFPCRVLNEKYPDIINIGDMRKIPEAISSGKVAAPDLICGGTPCQAFSLAGWQKGLHDDRANLTLDFVKIIEANDKKRLESGLDRCVVFWENVEGVLTDKTNAFGSLLASLAGLDEVIKIDKWPNAGIVRGKIRNIAWRVLDAKYFGIPQQRKRLYLLAGDTAFYPENVLFEKHNKRLPDYPNYSLTFEKDGHHFEIFREYTDCLYSAYGTKWNGNAAAKNGSLFVVQDGRIRRFSPLECERLMGFPDNYTDLHYAKKTIRYQAVGNSWAVPVVRWVGVRLMSYQGNNLNISQDYMQLFGRINRISEREFFFDFGKDIVDINAEVSINCTPIPEESVFVNIADIISPEAQEDIYISPVGCFGIIRRKRERNAAINGRLEEVLLDIAKQMRDDDIEKRSRIQKRGRYSDIQPTFEQLGLSL